jgi:peptide/nickel transport system substrate-binding protein
MNAGGVTSALAQARKTTLFAISEIGPNSYDANPGGANRATYNVAFNVYDRLLAFGMKMDGNGNGRYDSTDVQPALAEDFKQSGLSITFKLRKDAVFHDGTPVTAKDVKWSFERHAILPGAGKSTMEHVSLKRPEQYVVVDDHTFRFDLDRNDKIIIPALTTQICNIFNSGLARSHAGPNDPWATEWLKGNTAGSGAYKVTSQVGLQEVTFVRNDQWKCGRLPQMERVIWRVVPAVVTRRALIERGDADVSIELLPKDAVELAHNPRLIVISTPMQASVVYLSMNTKTAPFNNKAVRQAVGYAVPYDKILSVALHGQARLLSGAKSPVTTAQWPQPTQYDTDLGKAKQLLAEAGYPDGFETTLSYDLGSADTSEPTCVLIAENLAQVGIRAKLDKVAGSIWRAATLGKNLPMLLNLYGAYYEPADNYFYWAYHGHNDMFNTASYQDAEMDKYIEAAEASSDAASNEKNMIKAIQKAFDDLPVVPLYQPYYQSAVQRDLAGYRYWPNRALDFRGFHRG